MSLVKKIGMLSLGQALNILVGLLFLPYMSRALSYDEYGSYGQSILIIGAVATIVGVGLPQIINVYLSGEEKSYKITLSNNLMTALMTSLVGVLSLLFLADFFSNLFNNEILAPLVRVYAFSLLFSVPYTSLNSFLIYVGKIKASIFLSVLPNIVKVILVIISIQIYSSLYLALMCMVLSSALQFFMAIYFTRNDLNLKFRRVEMFQQLKDGLPLGMSGIVHMIILYTDSTMISSMLGVKEYAVYRMGALEVPFLASLYGYIAAIVLPEVTKLWTKGKLEELFNLKKKVIMNTVYIIYPVLIFLLFNSYNLITLYLGSNYEESAIIFSVFNLTLLFRVNFFGDILISANKGKIMLIYYVITAVTNIIMNYFLIKFFGGVGAAISTVLSVALLSILQLQKSLKISDKKLHHLISVKKIGITLLSSILIGTLIYLLVKNINNDPLKLLVFFVSYMLSIVLLFSYIKLYDKKIYINLISRKKT